MKLGLLIPEYPGQTHIFLWREMQELSRLGVAFDVVSTRRPPRKLISHAWAEPAIASTTYLVPIRAGELLGAMGQVLRAGPIGWWRLLVTIARSQRKLRVAAMIPVAGRLLTLARRGGWTHLHVHSCADSANLAMLMHRLGGPTFSMTLHGPLLSDYGPNQREKWRHARFAIVVSRALLNEVQRDLAGFLPPTIDVAPMGVDVAHVRRPTPYEPWPGSGECRIFSCGRLNAVKAHDDLIRAIALLRDRGIDVHLRIAGEDDSPDGAHRQMLAKLIEELKLIDRVELLGAVAEPAVMGQHAQAHVYALASLREGIPVATMEAMAMACPVVVTNVGGVGELVEHEVNGLLVEPRNVTQMADSIERVLRNPDLARRLATAARQTIVDRFDARLGAATLYRRAIDNAAGEAMAPRPQTLPASPRAIS